MELDTLSACVPCVKEASNLLDFGAKLGLSTSSLTSFVNAAIYTGSLGSCENGDNSTTFHWKSGTPELFRGVNFVAHKLY